MSRVPLWLVADTALDLALVSRLESLGFEPRSRIEGIAGLIDCRKPGSLDRLRQLRLEIDTHSTPVLAIVDASIAADFHAPLDAGADGVVAFERLDLEMAARVRSLPTTHPSARPRSLGTRMRPYEGFFTAFIQGIAVVGQGGEILTLNPAGSKMLGLTQPRTVGDLIPAVSPSGDEALQEILFLARESKPAGEVEIAIRKPAGEVATLAISAAPLGSAAHPEMAGCVTLCFRDVTKARAMQSELRKTKEFMERLIDQASDAIVAADMRGTVILFNQGAERIFGYRTSEAVGHLNVRSLYYPDTLPQDLMKKIRSEEHGGLGRLLPTQVEIVAKSGERVPVSMTAAMITEEIGGKLHDMGTVGIFSDLREKMRLEMRLSATQAQLEQQGKAAVVAELAGTAAHELNQPLTSIMGYSELLRRRLRDDDPNVRAIEIVYREAERMAEIVRKIGKITRYETKPYVGGARIVDLERATKEGEDA